MGSLALEIAVQDVAGALVAHKVAADRIEVCAALAPTGGLTPSIGLVAEIVALGAVPVHVLVRPRAGGFTWTAAELAVQVRDIAALVAAGVDGVVIGALTAYGTVDEHAIETLRSAADGVQVTFHRALDIVADLPAALDTMVGLGIDRVLTSGRALRCIDGLPVLARLVAHAAGRIEIQAGGGVRPADVAALRAVGVDAVHLSASRMHSAHGGPGGGGEGGYSVTDFALAAAARRAVDAAGGVHARRAERG